jgi:AraC-like DNA-binding protein
MTFDEFSASLPADRTVEFSAVEEMEEAFNDAGIDQPMRQIGRGRFRAVLAQEITKDAEFYSDRYNRSLSMHLAPINKSVGIVFPRSVSGDFLAGGENIGNDKLVVIPPGSGVDIVGHSLFGSESIVISEERFAELTETLCPTIERPECTALFEGDHAQLLALRQAVADIVAHSELGSDEEEAANIVASSIAWMGESSKQHSSIELSERVACNQVAKIAQQYVDLHYQESVHIEDLCRVTGVGARTMQRCFRKYFDMPVSTYLKTLRLDSARRELVTAHSSEVSVTDIAMSNGCTHLGRFSVEFREQFGVSPHDVLDSRPGKK